jgi:hypothetical protein
VYVDGFSRKSTPVRRLIIINAMKGVLKGTDYSWFI